MQTILQSQRLLYGTVNPNTAGIVPELPNETTTYLLLNAAGNAEIGFFKWSPVIGAWVAAPATGANSTIIEPFGWIGQNKDTFHRDAVPGTSTLPANGNALLTFEMGAANLTPLNFEIVEFTAGTVLYTGVMPAFSLSETAAGVVLTDAITTLPVTTVPVSAVPMRLFARPTGGRSAAPAGGVDFKISGLFLFS